MASQAQAINFERWEDVATLENAEYGDIEHVALLGRYDDGSQFIIARTICKNCIGIAPGARIGEDIIIDGNAVWGSNGVSLNGVWGSNGVSMTNIEISSIPTPERGLDGPWGLETPPRLIGLLDNGNIVDLQGVWGTGGAAIPDITDWFPEQDDWMPEPHEWLVSATGLNFDATTCGKPTEISESTVHLTVNVVAPHVPARKGLFPAFAVGTENGCVGMVGFDNPLIAFENPEVPGSYFDNPLIAFDNPLIGFEDPRVTFDNPLIGFDNPLIGFDNPLIGMAPVPRDTSGDHWGGYGVVMAAGSKLTSLDTGRWVYDEAGPSIVHAESDDTFKTNFVGMEMAAGAEQTQIATMPILYGDSNDIIIPIPGGDIFYLGSPVVVSDGTNEVRVGLVSGNHAGISFNSGDTVNLSKPIGRMSLGSLLAITPDGQEVIFAPDFHPNNLPGSGAVTEVSLGGVQSVSMGPRTFSLGAKGKKVTAVIEANGNEAANINVDSIRLSVGGIDPTPSLLPVRTNLVDKDHDGNLELVAKFSRPELADWLAQLHPEHNVAGLILSWETLVDFCGDDVDEPCPGSYPTVMRIID